MRLFFDVDGVLLNFERGFVQWLNVNFGKNLPEDYEASSWYFDDVLTEEQCREAWHVFLGSEDAGRLQPYLEPARFNALTGERAVHLLTNFPDLHMETRVENLAALGFRYESLHHCGFSTFDPAGTPSKSQIVSNLLQPGERGLFVDDHPRNCLDVAENCPGVEVWLMSRKFNRDFDHPEIRRAAGWPPIVERLEQIGNAPSPSAAGAAFGGR